MKRVIKRRRDGDEDKQAPSLSSAIKTNHPSTIDKVGLLRQITIEVLSPCRPRLIHRCSPGWSYRDKKRQGTWFQRREPPLTPFDTPGLRRYYQSAPADIFFTAVIPARRRIPMKLAYFDCFSGISGDMTLGALVDAGCDLEQLRAGLRGLQVPGWELSAEKVRKNGMAAT